jgi:hypothetical protein
MKEFKFLQNHLRNNEIEKIIERHYGLVIVKNQNNVVPVRSIIFNRIIGHHGYKLKTENDVRYLVNLIVAFWQEIPKDALREDVINTVGDFILYKIERRDTYLNIIRERV